MYYCGEQNNSAIQFFFNSRIFKSTQFSTLTYCQLWRDRMLLMFAILLNNQDQYFKQNLFLNKEIKKRSGEGWFGNQLFAVLHTRTHRRCSLLTLTYNCHHHWIHWILGSVELNCACCKHFNIVWIYFKQVLGHWKPQQSSCTARLVPFCIEGCRIFFLIIKHFKAQHK